MGTYKCNDDDTDCTVTLDAKGAITGIRPIAGSSLPLAGATSDVADADYLHYGFWLKNTTDADGATTYNEVETFAKATGIRCMRRTTVAGLFGHRHADLQRRRRGRVREERVRPDGGYYRFIGHLRPLHGGREPDGVPSVATTCLSTHKFVTGTITNSSCSTERQMTGSVALKGANITEREAGAPGESGHGQWRWAIGDRVPLQRHLPRPDGAARS